MYLYLHCRNERPRIGNILFETHVQDGGPRLPGLHRLPHRSYHQHLCHGHRLIHEGIVQPKFPIKGDAAFPGRQDHGDILQDGAALYQLDISQEGNRTISIEYQGRTNLIEICDSRIRVAEADCPDQLCVQMGWLQNSGLPIVCLPNRLVIQYAQSLDGLDAIS